MKNILTFLILNKKQSLLLKIVCSFAMLALLLTSFLVNKSTYNFYDVFFCNNTSTYCYIYSEEDFKENLTAFNSNKQLINCVKNGSKWFVNFNNKTVLQNIKPPQYKQVTGNFSPTTLQKALKKVKAKLVKVENYNNIKILFFYTPVWQDYRQIENYKINLQIAINSSSTTIGYPMIYGSF